MLVSPFVEWRRNGPLDRKHRTDQQKEYLDSSFEGEDEIFRFFTVHLNQENKKKLIEGLQTLIQDLRLRSESDYRGRKQRAEPFSFIVAGRSFIPSFILKYRRMPPSSKA